MRLSGTAWQTVFGPAAGDRKLCEASVEMWQGVLFGVEAVFPLESNVCTRCSAFAEQGGKAGCWFAFGKNTALRIGALGGLEA